MPDRAKVIKGLEQFRADFKPFCGNGSDWARVDDAIVLLKEQPEIVRCKGCKHWNEVDHDCNIKIGHFTALPDWFCADGERR